MNTEINIEERKPIWIALSDFYLDTELEDYRFRYIASIVQKSPYTLEKVKEIDKQEIFPVLHANLLAATGVWNGFQEEWLIEKILERMGKKTRFSDFILLFKYTRLKWMYKEYWKKLEEAYTKP